MHFIDAIFLILVTVLVTTCSINLYQEIPLQKACEDNGGEWLGSDCYDIKKLDLGKTKGKTK